MEETKTDFNAEALKAHKKNLEREFKEHSEKLKFHEDLLLQLEADKKARLRNHDIMIAKFIPVNPQWEFERDAEYLENLKILQAHVKLQDENKYMVSQTNIERVIELARESVESAKAELERLGDE